jgi:hypothetical protein
MHLDYYAATCNEDPKGFIQSVLDNFDGSVFEPAKPRQGYDYAANICTEDTRHTTVLWGGINGGLHALASGERAEPFSHFMRALYPAHTVPRVDVAQDFTGPGCWDALFPAVVSFATEKNLQICQYGNYLTDTDKGRTLYVGSRKSVVYLRLYEKGKQLGTDPNHVRLEIEVKPQNPKGKAWAAKATAQELWGASRWSMNLAASLLSVYVDRFPAGTVRSAPSEFLSALEWMMGQWGGHLDQLAQHVGGWEAVGPALVAIRASREARQAIYRAKKAEDPKTLF